jgi:hypothetical protein
MATSSRYTIPGSEKSPMAGALALHAADPDERFEVTLRLRARSGLQG